MDQDEPARRRGVLYTEMRGALKARGLETSEALEALDFILDVASTYRVDGPHHHLATLWHEWDWAECLSAANEMLEEDLRGREEEG